MYKRILFLMLFVVSLSFVFGQTDKLTFNDVVKQLDLSKKTKLAVKNNWQSLKGTEVIWKAKVKDVKGGRGKAQILATNKNSKTYKGYNLVLTTFDMDAAAKLDLGQHIKFSGQLHKYKAKDGGLVILYLTEVQIIKTK